MPFMQLATPITLAIIDTIRRAQVQAGTSDSSRTLEGIAVPQPSGSDSMSARRSDAEVPSPAANGMVTFVFGRSNPALTCTVLRACLVELEAGEVLVNEPIAGDHVRWIITRARAGPGGTSALVIVKPKACDISTNLVLSTERRVYDMDLESPACRAGDTNPKRRYTRHIRFEYPEDTARKVAREIAKLDQPTSSPPSNERAEHEAAPAPLPPDSGSRNRDYRVARDRRGPFGLLGDKAVDFPWTPSAIWDDGAHVYVIMPREAQRYAAPVLYALEDDGSRTMMNFAMRDSTIVTDRIFRRGILVLTAGNREQSLEFENLSWGKATEPTRRP